MDVQEARGKRQVARGEGQKKRALYFGKVTPDEAAARAQVVVIVDDGRWFIYAPAPYRCHGSGAVPVVSCPVVDCSAIPDEKFAEMAGVIGVCVDAVHGVINRGGLLTGLEALGGVRLDEGLMQDEADARYRVGDYQVISY